MSMGGMVNFVVGMHKGHKIYTMVDECQLEDLMYGCINRVIHNNVELLSPDFVGARMYKNLHFYVEIGRDYTYEIGRTILRIHRFDKDLICLYKAYDEELLFNPAQHMLLDKYPSHVDYHSTDQHLDNILIVKPYWDNIMQLEKTRMTHMTSWD